MKVKLRNPTLNDLKKIYEIETSSFVHPYSALSLFSLIMLHSDTSLVAEVNGEVVGFAIAAKEVGKKLHLLNFAVHPKYRRMGIGSALLRSLEKLAKKKGVKEIYLEVEEDNFAAISLYEKMGFKKKKIIKKYYPWGKDAVVMVKELA